MAMEQLCVQGCYGVDSVVRSSGTATVVMLVVWEVER